MFKKISLFLTGAYLYSPLAALAESPSKIIERSACQANPGSCDKNLFGPNSIFKQVTTGLIFIVGAISVLMIIIGGLRYVTSGGDPAGVKGARDTILYAVIGVIVAILSYALVAFVTNRVG